MASIAEAVHIYGEDNTTVVDMDYDTTVLDEDITFTQSEAEYEDSDSLGMNLAQTGA